jgi:acetoacetyl-CoA synthetase
MQQDQPLWSPSQASIDAANMTRFIKQVNQRHGLSIGDYDALYRWSLDDSETFWSDVWDFCDIVGDKGERILLDGDDIEKATWFPDASLNFAENLLRRKSSEIAIYFRAEDQAGYELTWDQLHEQVASVSAWLRAQGLNPGDRVAAYIPNMPEAVVAMLAATSLGAVWTSTSPDFGVDSVVDRFGQTEPRFLLQAGIQHRAGGADRPGRVWQPDRRGRLGRHQLQPGRLDRFRAAQFQRPPLRALLFGHYRQTQVYYARGGRHADPAHEGADAALRSSPR